MKQSASWEVNRFSASQEIPGIYEHENLLPRLQQRAICPYTEPDQSSPFLHPTSWRSTLILSSHLRLGLPSGLFPLDIPTKTLYARLVSPTRATFPAQLILLDVITRKI
jgi:hypothetical protein